MDISVTIHPFELKFSVGNRNVLLKGSMSQNCTGQYSIVCYRPILANGLLWPVDQHRVSEKGLYFLRLFSIEEPFEDVKHNSGYSIHV